MEAKRVADLTVEELQAIILETKPVSDLTVGELKAIIAEVVDRRLINWLNTANQKSYIVPPARTKEEQTQGNLAEKELLQKWLEEGNAEERIELGEFYQKLLNKAPIKSSLWEGIDAAIEMMQSLPETLQQQVAEYLKEYIAELKDELQWDESFKKTQPQLVAAAQRAKQEIAEGKAQEMKLNDL